MRFSATPAHINFISIRAERIRITQVALLTAALVMGLLTPAFNGLSLLALILVGIAYYLGARPVRAANASAATASTEIRENRAA